MINRLKGSVSLTAMIGWGVSISIALGGFFWAKVAQTDNAVAEVRTNQITTQERLATVEEAVKNLIKTTDETRSDVKELLRRSR